MQVIWKYVVSKANVYHDVYQFQRERNQRIVSLCHPSA